MNERYTIDDFIEELTKATRPAFTALSESAKKIIISLRELVKGLKRNRHIFQDRGKAYIRSQRNNQYVKRYKHGRTQKNRVKRK